MLYNSLKKIAEDFELLESDGGTNTNVPNASDDPAADEAAVINKLDRSVKFDEVDTVTFGLETDDGKIVKVYVNAEQAEAFEKALATKLGEIDDIEEVLNELSKEYEIVDVEWPEEGDEDDKDLEDEQDDGSSSLDQRVYGPKQGKEEVEDIPDRQFQGSESLNYGELVTLELLESTTSLESRFTTPTQLMVYHAIIDLGVPEIALARNANRNEIIKGIKSAAEAMQKNATMKGALKMFIRRANDFEKQAKENEAAEETQDKRVAYASSQSKPELQGAGNKGVKEEMKIKINEEHADWTFSSDKENLTISAKGVSIVLDSEETEKLIKGINNHSITVVRDATEDPAKKYVFSPRGSSILVKAVGSPDGVLMLSTDVKELIDTAAPERKPSAEEDVKESLTESSSTITDVVNELLSPRGTTVAEYDVTPDTIELTVDHDMPEHGFTATAIKSKFKGAISKFTVEKGPAPYTARTYIITPKMDLSDVEARKISSILKKKLFK